MQKDADDASLSPLIGLGKLFVPTTQLHKTESFVRKFVIPYHICFHAHPNNPDDDDGSTGADDESADSRRADLYTNIQWHVNQYGTKTLDARWSYDMTATFYKLILRHFKYGNLDVLDDVHFAELLGELVDQVKRYNKWLKKARQAKKSKQKCPPRSNADGMSIPAFLLAPDGLKHLLRYFTFFVRRERSNVHFAWSEGLGIYLHAVQYPVDMFGMITVLAEEPTSIFPTHIDMRSVYGRSTQLHLFGVGSYISHGCTKHSHFKLPGSMTAGRVYNLRTTTRTSNMFKETDTYPIVLRWNYGSSYRNLEQLTCVSDDCYADKTTGKRRRCTDAGINERNAEDKTKYAI